MQHGTGHQVHNACSYLPKDVTYQFPSASSYCCYHCILKAQCRGNSGPKQYNDKVNTLYGMQHIWENLFSILAICAFHINEDNFQSVSVDCQSKWNCQFFNLLIIVIN